MAKTTIKQVVFDRFENRRLAGDKRQNDGSRTQIDLRKFPSIQELIECLSAG